MRRWLFRMGSVGRPAADDRSGPGRPPAGAGTPPERQVIDHPFDPWQVPSTGLWICLHLDGIRPCGRPEHEHAPAEGTEAGAAGA